MPYNKEKQLLFIHIPKCGGTSIEKSLGSFSEIGVGIKNGKAIQHYTLKDYQNNLLFTNNFIKFSIVRNPYNRAISDFKWFKNYSKLNFKTLDEYLDYAENYIKNNYKPNTIWDDHFMPQYEYLLTSKNKIITENIFRFEDRKSINKKTICLFTEYLLRYLQHIYYDGKIWYIPPEIATLNHLEKK